MADDFLSHIDEVIAEVLACACGCGNQITERSHSTWFASAACQATWNRARCGDLPDWSKPVELADGPRPSPPVVAVPSLFAARARVPVAAPMASCPYLCGYHAANVEVLGLHTTTCERRPPATAVGECA